MRRQLNYWKNCYRKTLNQPHFAIRLAHCYLIKEKTHKARKVVQLIRSQQEMNSVTLLVLQARVLMQEGNFEKALQYIQEALHLNADQPGLKFYLGFINFELGKYEEAISVLDEALERDPKSENGSLNEGEESCSTQKVGGCC
jgi:tetratricopeptide (TPR) repeat protein